MLKVRKATYEDLPIMQEIFKCAREYMRNNGNPTQWGTTSPSIDLIERDLNRGVSYLVLDGEEAVGTFSFTVGDEPTYKIINDGVWLNEKPYGAMHRIASNGKAKGVFETAYKLCLTFGVDVRVDTHENNKTMRNLVRKFGFKYCGIITAEDGTPRLAFHKQV